MAVSSPWPCSVGSWVVNPRRGRAGPCGRRCQRAVEARLVAPATASWPNWITEVPEVRTNDAKTEGAVLSHVDAQNRFEAKIRTKFVCLMKKQGAAWVVTRLEIE